VRAEIVRAWLGSCGDPELEWHLRTNLLLRWFVGLPVFASTPDHSTLNRFHAWLTTHQPDALFRDVLRFLDQVDPEDPHATQIVDTVGMETPAAWAPSAAHLLRDVCADLVRAWQTHAPGHLQAVLPTYDWPTVLQPPRPRTEETRQAQRTQAVQVSQTLVAALTPHLPALAPALQATLQPMLAALPKIIADEFIQDTDGMLRERTAKEKGTYRIISATDLEATFRKHDDDLILGWNAAIATTMTRIRAVTAVTGATPDSETPALLLQQQIAAGAALPHDLVMDRAGGWGKTRARVASLSDDQTQMVALLPPAGGADPDRFGPNDFHLNTERTSCTCPNGVTTTRVYVRTGNDGVDARFLASQCRDCPLWARCRGPDSTPKSHRAVYFSAYQPHLRAAARRNMTPEGQRLLGMRWRVEPTLAWLTRYQGCRRARRVGPAAAQVQLFQACAVRNLLTWLARVDRGTAPRPAALPAVPACG
jgi:hypothetical protein